MKAIKVQIVIQAIAIELRLDQRCHQGFNESAKTGSQW